MSKSLATQRREYADLIEQRRHIDHTIAKVNGTLEPASAKVKRTVEGIVTGMLLGDLWRSLRD